MDKPRQPIGGHVNQARALNHRSVTPDGTLAVSGSLDSTLILWDVATGQAVRLLNWPESGGVYSVAFGPDGQYVLAGGNYGLMSLWRVDATLDDLTGWIDANRYVAPLTCDQRALYLIMPLCD